MRDITLGETFYHFFTTRAFATGVPTVLAGTPVLSVLEENNATPITAGVSVSVDRASVTGLNQATIVATSGNGYEAGKSYAIYISTGTVDGTSVVGEVVGEFTVQASAAFTRLGTPAGASLAADLADVPTATENADALLDRNMATGADTNARSPRNALRFLRNKRATAAGTLTVTKEDDTTSAWTAALTTDAAAVPVVTVDPA